MTNQEINEIIEGLDKLHILEVVTEQAFKRIKTAEVTSVARGYTELWSCYLSSSSGERSLENP